MATNEPKDEPTPLNLSWELARISNQEVVVEGSVEHYDSGGGAVEIRFDIKTEKTLFANNSGIADIEPIRLSYTSTGSVGRIAPSVTSGRDDFPRDLPHLNPIAEGEPASLCLARAGLQSIYDQFGVAGVLARLDSWLSDAKTGNLHKDGWEPVPTPSLENCMLGQIDAAALQEHALAHPDGGHGYLFAALRPDGPNGRGFVAADGKVLDVDDKGEFDLARTLMQATWNNENRNMYCQAAARGFSKRAPRNPGEFTTGLPGIFVWPPINEIQEASCYTTWGDMPGVLTGLEGSNLLEAAQDAEALLDFRFGERSDADKAGNAAFLLITGLWRPTSLDPTILGLSKDLTARRLELRAFYLERPIAEKNRWTETTRVRPFASLCEPDSETFEAISGEPALSKTALIGGGALGGAFLDYAARGGAREIVVIDDDLLLPHNLARHSEFIPVIRAPKSLGLKIGASHRSIDCVVDDHHEDILELDAEALVARFQACEAIIDATADARVRRLLSSLEAPPGTALLRTELFNRGRLGVFFGTRVGASENLKALYYQLILKAHTEKCTDIAEWLSYEKDRRFIDDELSIGMGCSTATTKLPAYKVAAQASALFAASKRFVGSDGTPVIGINVIGEGGEALGWCAWSASAMIRIIPKEGAKDWTLIVSQDALDNIHKMRTNAAPDETGGYLYGGLDVALREIYIVVASSLPPDSEATPKGLKLGPAGRTGFERAMTRRVSGRLGLVGTWHSHPDGAPAASGKDRATINGFREKDIAKGTPTVMMITGETDDAAYVYVD